MQPEVLTTEQQASARKAGLVLRACLKHVSSLAVAGANLLDIDAAAEAFIIEQGGEPGFKGYHGYTATLCASVNEQCVHGIPSDRILEEGDIVSLDCGVRINGINTDACVTVAVGSVSPEAKNLMTVTEKALNEIIPLVKAGTKTGDISAKIQAVAEAGGVSPVKSLTGHGLGTTLHQPPDIPNLGVAGTGAKLVAGTLVAIEPIFSTGANMVAEENDGWTLSIVDGGLSAHFEHTFLVGDLKSEIIA